jgi:hypothetical protein
MFLARVSGFFFVLLSALPVMCGEGRVKIAVSPDPHEVKKTVSVAVQNETRKTIWYCVQVSKTPLHDSEATIGSPVPQFRIRFRKTTKAKWRDLMWSPDYGGLTAPEQLGAGEERKYGIVLSEAGYYQLELAFRDDQVSSAECGQELKGVKRSRSRVFLVSQTERTTECNHGQRQGTYTYDVASRTNPPHGRTRLYLRREYSWHALVA